ncbi:acyl-CoA/acyl-ACP dehydrogenase [Myxococcota bacterium]|nr:acyl-CoA/acyl-ACP dehydrogenase [Myxococcota bacterium]MCZ7617411.1 acyl-CoA/acyl-ACP dehydrogenase [Myxococcota bacterium]
MDFACSDEQQALRELAREILETEVTPDRLREIETSEERIDRKLWSTLAEANLLGVALPEAYGGSGYGFFELCVLLEEIGRAVAPVPAWAALACAAAPIARFGSEALQRRWLPPLLSGETLLSAALAESDNPDPLAPATKARADGPHWRLDGAKFCVPAGHVAERVLVPAALPDARVGLFLVDPSGAGVRLERQFVTDRSLQAWLTLDGVRVAGDDVVGSFDVGRDALQWTVERAIAGLCAMQVGVADKALRITAGYAAQRHQFGRPIGSFQAVHTRAADAYCDLESMRLVALQAAYLLSRSPVSASPDAVAREELATDAVQVAKVLAGEAGHAVAYAAMHLHGGIGVDVDYPVHRYYLWARQIELTLGSSASTLAAIGERLAQPD